MSRSMLMRTYSTCLVLLAVLTLGAHAEDQATETAEPVPTDEITLNNGSRLVGTVTGIRDGVVSIETDFAGTLSVSMDQIVSMETSDAATLLLADDSLIEEQGIEIRESELIVAEGTAAEKTYALDQLLVVNPEPWETGAGYRSTGIVSFAFAIERGNSDTDELDYKLESYWRSLRDRYTLKLDGEIDEAKGQKNADNWLILGKYDYFLGETTYWGVNTSAESDEFRDLDLRYLIGPYYGRDILTDPQLTLTAEVGGSYVKETFIISEDQDYPSANWYLRMTSDYLGGDSQLYLDQRGIWNLDSTSDVVVDTSLGLAFPLLWSLEAAAEILWEYDTGAVAGVEKLDETYRLRIGYSW